MKITLQSHRDYMQRMLSSMSIRDAKRHQSYIQALYATEAYLVDQARKKSLITKIDECACEKGKSPAFAGPSPMYAFSIANAHESVNA